MNSTQKARLPYETRLEILRLIDSGLSPQEISRKLYVPIVGVHKAIKWRAHQNAHQSVNRRQPHDHSQPQPQPPRDNGGNRFPRHVVLKNACGSCHECRQNVTAGLHVVEIAEDKPAMLYCQACCPECKTKKGEN